jgi:hypothetical protein
MRPTILAIFALLPLLTSCGGWGCDCGGYEDFTMPDGEFNIAKADDEFIAAGTVTFTEDTLTFSYTDPDGNEWEIEYVVTDDFTG